LYGYVLGDPINLVDPEGLAISDAFSPKFDLRFCPIAAAAATDTEFCKNIVNECLYNGTLGNMCKSASLFVCEGSCVATEYYNNLKKYCTLKIKKPKLKK